MTLNQNYKREVTRFSAFQITSPDHFGFSAETYSKFKYGAENIAQQFVYTLAEKFIKNCFSHRLTGSRLLFCQVPIRIYLRLRFI